MVTPVPQRAGESDMQKLTTAYCPKDGAELRVVAQHKAGRDTGGMLTVFENCPKCAHWLTYAAGSLSYSRSSSGSTKLCGHLYRQSYPSTAGLKQLDLVAVWIVQRARDSSP